MNRPRVLLVTYLFPPCGGVGVQRALGIAHHMPQAGVDLHVLTARNPISQHGLDPGLVQKVPPEVRLHHADAWEPPRAVRNWAKRASGDGGAGGGKREARSASATAGRESGLKRLVKQAAERLLFPDPQVLWAKPSIAAASRLIEKEQIGHVMLTLPPFSLLSMAIGLRRNFPNLRIVLDFRDEWLDYHLPEMDSGATPWKRRQAAVLEAEAVRAADVVVTVTQTWVEGFRRRYPQEAPEKFIYTPNGFDANALPAQAAKDKSGPPPAPPLVIGYMGTVYSNPVYSPASYLAALEALPEEWRDRVETRFYGRVAPDAELLLENRVTRVIRTGFLPQQEAFGRLAQSHGLLLIVGNPTVHSAKLFEYLAMKIPILAISPPEGEVGRLIREVGAGWCVAGEDRAGIQAAVRELYVVATGEKVFPHWADSSIARYDRRNLIPEMARACGMLGG